MTTNLSNELNLTQAKRNEKLDSTRDIIDSAVKKLAICDKILSIAQSHQTWCPYTKCKREHILNSQANNLKHLSVQIDSKSASEQELNSQEIERLELWRCVCALIGPDSVRIVEFAKRIPSFKNINQNYQILLIKAHFFKVWLLRISCMLIGSDETLVPTDSASNRFLSFESGHCISQDQLEIVFGKELADKVIQFSSHLNTLRLNDIEIGLICSILLTSLNNSYLNELIDYESKSTINTIHQELFEALKFEISNRFDTTNQNEQQSTYVLNTTSQESNHPHNPAQAHSLLALLSLLPLASPNSLTLPYSIHVLVGEY